jgi:hypothetical protein
LNGDLVVLRRAVAQPARGRAAQWQVHGAVPNPTQVGRRITRRCARSTISHGSGVLRPLGAADALSRVASGVPVVMSDPGWPRAPLTTALRLVQEVPNPNWAFARMPASGRSSNNAW